MSPDGALAPETLVLTTSEASERLMRYGPNALPEAEPIQAEPENGKRPSGEGP